MQRRTFFGTLATGFAFLMGARATTPSLAVAMPAVQPESTPLVVTDLWPRVKLLLRPDVIANMQLETQDAVVEVLETSGKTVVVAGYVDPTTLARGALELWQREHPLHGMWMGPQILAEPGTGTTWMIGAPAGPWKRTTRLVTHLGCEIDTVEEGVVQLAKIIEQFHDRFGIAACLARALAIPLVSGKVMVVSYLAPLSNENIYPSPLSPEYQPGWRNPVIPSPLPEGAVTFEWVMIEGGRGRYVGNHPFDYDGFFKKMHEDINNHALRCMSSVPGHHFPSEKMIPRGIPTPWSNPS